MMYVKEDRILFIQWLDKGAASLQSSPDHAATDQDDAQRYFSEDSEW